MPHLSTSISNWPFAGAGVGVSTTSSFALVHVTDFMCRSSYTDRRLQSRRLS